VFFPARAAGGYDGTIAEEADIAKGTLYNFSFRRSSMHSSSEHFRSAMSTAWLNCASCPYPPRLMRVFSVLIEGVQAQKNFEVFMVYRMKR
jgi:hypothetical protein